MLKTFIAKMAISKAIVLEILDGHDTERTNISLPYLAMMEQHYDIAEFFLECGYDVNYKNHNNIVITKDNFFNTPLHVAAEKGHTDIVKLFLEHSANINDTNRNHMTPLHCAIKNGKVETYELIVNHIAKLEAAGEHVSEENLKLKKQLMPEIQKRTFIYNNTPATML